uniref:Protein regulator of cytokinesis 1 n=1 Tax=Timema monikensis TaxID=170555 RepID=A0A7R9EBQ8_9NEOP|nr:unnamed protein product [Timema monikensis]
MTQHSWENMYQELCGDLEQCLAHLHTLWEEVGHDEHSQELRRNTVKNHVQRLLKEMVVEETDMKQSLISKIETLMVESGTLGKFCPNPSDDDLSTLCIVWDNQHLHITSNCTTIDISEMITFSVFPNPCKLFTRTIGNPDLMAAVACIVQHELPELSVDIKCDGFEDLPLVDIERGLRRKLEDYRNLKNTLMEKMTQQKLKESELCKKLDIAPRKLCAGPIPTEMELKQFEEYLLKLSTEKNDLERDFLEMKEKIIAIIKEIQWVPSLDFEKMIVCENDSEFILSKENMSKLKKLLEKLDAELEEAKSLRVELQDKLTLLWDRLHIGHNDRKKFLSRAKGCVAEVINMLRQEVNLCEDLKRQNIKTYVQQTRKELNEWWSRCHFANEQKRQFIPFFSDCYTEDLLDLHELETQKLKTFYESNINMFQLLDKRQKLWDKRLDLENRANDPSRLFENRGGQLLQEEKERRLIQKDLPKIETELLNLARKYENEHNKPFLVNGEDITEIIKRQWDSHKAGKEREKMTRKKARDQQTEVDSKLGTKSTIKLSASKRTCPRGTTPTRVEKKMRLEASKPQTPSQALPSTGRARCVNIRPRGPAKHISRNIFPSNQEDNVQEPLVGSSEADPLISQPRDLSIASSVISYNDFQLNLKICYSNNFVKMVSIVKELTYKSSRKLLSNPARGVIDGELVSLFLGLPYLEKVEVAKKIGTKVDEITDDLADIERLTSHF